MIRQPARKQASLSAAAVHKRRETRLGTNGPTIVRAPVALARPRLSGTVLDLEREHRYVYAGTVSVRFVEYATPSNHIWLIAVSHHDIWLRILESEVSGTFFLGSRTNV